MNPILNVIEISKIYGEGDNKVVAVNSISLALNPGEVCLIMGPSGSGKTTLLSMMGCILRPTSGRVMVNGQEVQNLDENSFPDIRRRYFGFVFQAFNLFPSLTVVENVELVMRLKGHNKKDIRSKALELVERVNLGKRANFYPGNLSGGEKQRTAFARALAGNPDIVLADEPTGSLDSKSGREVLELLRNIAVESGKAVAIVSHDPKAEEIAHRVIFIEDGRLKL